MSSRARGVQDGSPTWGALVTLGLSRVSTQTLERLDEFGRTNPAGTGEPFESDQQVGEPNEQ